MRLLLWFGLVCACALAGDHLLAVTTGMILVGCATDRVRR